jgi:hypothetical protein
MAAANVLSTFAQAGAVLTPLTPVRRLLRVL